jgi:hypothetical protein
MAGATLEPAGSGVAGVQPKGITQQYQKSAVVANKNTSTDITPYDSGTILGTVPPGKPGIKLVSGVVQRSNQLKCDATPGVVGNALVGIAGVGRAIPTSAAGTTKADGLSGSPDRE